MTDPEHSILGKMLLDEITPVVMVLTTPLVEEACLKNGLSLVEMLSPFCNFNNIDVPVRTSSDQPYRLQKFKLRLFYASDIRQPNLEATKERLNQVITQAGEEDISDLSSDPPEISDTIARLESEVLPAWFQSFNKELVRTLSFSDHEAFDHPVACIVVVSSKDKEPINRFVDLFNINNLPSLFNDGTMDPKILKHYLLLHDNQDDTSEKATKILTEMRNTFGSNGSQLLCINSSQDGNIQHPNSLWASFKSDTASGENIGCFLNVDDVNEIKDLIQELSSKHIIPYMEQKIRSLNQHVSATRKGFRNQIKNLWWRKGKDDTSDSHDGSIYTFSSVESQIRILGDYAFMLRDYELALSSYRLISTDYKLDKAWKRYAGVQEMMGLTFFISDQSKKEAEYCMENAFNTYTKMGSAGLKNATRCGLWWVAMLKTRDQQKEAATVYFRICGEEPLHAAIMLEQASYCYLLSKPPMLHKYGFHLVLSGDRYKKCDQIKHAIRTYRSAINVYKGTTWSHIKDHVHFHIGQCYDLLGMYDVAIKNMLEVLACSDQAKSTQELFLRNFLHIVQKTGKTYEVVKLQLPVINMSSLKFIFEDHRTYASPSAASFKESIWRALEEDVIPSLPTARVNWLDLQSKIMSKKFKESNVCVAGEPIKVDIEFRNPLQVSISVSSISLICEISPRTDEVKSGSSSIQQEDGTIGETSPDISMFTLSEVDIVLEGGETAPVQLAVTPRVEGILQIVGIRWKLSGSVVGVHNFESNLVQKTTANGRRKTRHSPSKELKFIVIKSLPRLKGSIRSFPEKAYAGDLRHLVLELRNQSELPVKNLKMKISHPRFLSIGDQAELTAKFPECLEKKGDAEETSMHVNSNKTSHGVFKTSHGVFLFPEDISVQGETPLLWSLWFRAAVPGNISLHITLYYEMGDISGAMRYRTLRMHYNLKVLPSLDVTFHISPCPSRLEEFLVRMDVANQTSAEDFQILQLSSSGNQWEISLLQPVDTILPSQALLAGQVLSWFFMLKDRKKLKASQDKCSSLSLVGKDVRLGPQNDKTSLFDISKSPLAGFHDCERSNQAASHQGDPDSADFILISRPSKSSIRPGVSNPPVLSSHHACDCSTSRTSPISWLVDGPQTIRHNFSTRFCEIKLKMRINNSSNGIAVVRINTSDLPTSSGQLNDAQSAIVSGNQTGWHDLPLVNDIKVTTDVLGTTTRVGKSSTVESVAPFIWSGSSSTKVQVQPMSTTEVPLQISVFSPGIYDLSNYVLYWNLLPVDGKENPAGSIQTSGTCQGYPYFLSVLQC